MNRERENSLVHSERGSDVIAPVSHTLVHNRFHSYDRKLYFPSPGIALPVCVTNSSCVIPRIDREARIPHRGAGVEI